MDFSDNPFIPRKCKILRTLRSFLEYRHLIVSSDDTLQSNSLDISDYTLNELSNNSYDIVLNQFDFSSSKNQSASTSNSTSTSTSNNVSATPSIRIQRANGFGAIIGSNLRRNHSNSESLFPPLQHRSKNSR